VRKAEILIKENLGEMPRTKAWNDLVKSETDLTALAYVALQVEARRPGTIPAEMIDHVGGRVSLGKLSSSCLGSLGGESNEYIDDLEKLLEQPGEIETLLAISRLRRVVDGPVTPEIIEALREEIEKDIETFRALMEEPAGKKVA